MPADERRPIPPNPPRWQPNPDPTSIQVPGLDTSASMLDQIEQIDQLITIKLQNIDENFSKIHHLLATKLLPAIKRYAVGTEPVREAAKFWTSFYEQAAQIRIPTYDDYSTVNDLSEQVDTRDQPRPQAGSSQSHIHDPSMASTEGSFMPGHAAFSSTPATARVIKTDDSYATQDSDDHLWTTSMESPLVRLDREFQKFSEENENEENTLAPQGGQLPSLQFDEPTPKHKQHEFDVQPSSGKGKDKEAYQPLLRNVLRHNLYSTSDVSSVHSTSVSSLKHRSKQRTPVPKKYNPYLPPDTDPADWSGVVDLRDPLVTTPQRQRKPLSRHTPNIQESDDDDSFDGLPPGMSPPVMMSPARPPRSSAELGLLKLGQTPRKEASARITRDLLNNIQYKNSGQAHSESSMSTIPTPPSLSRYHRHGMDTTDSIIMDSSLESMMRRVGLSVPSNTGTASTPGLRLHPRTEPYSVSSSSSKLPPAAPHDSMTPVQTHADLDIDSDSDSLDEINNTAHPSAAFLMASAQARHDSDDSFGSSNHSADSLTEEDVNLGLAPVHPFARDVEGDGFEDDDSYDDLYDEPGGEVQEETLFGVPPEARMQAQQRLHPGGGYLGSGLRMLGDDLLQETIGIGAQMVRSGRIEESPTPASGPRS